MSWWIAEYAWRSLAGAREELPASQWYMPAGRTRLRQQTVGRQWRAQRGCRRHSTCQSEYHSVHQGSLPAHGRNATGCTCKPADVHSNSNQSQSPANHNHTITITKNAWQSPAYSPPSANAPTKLRVTGAKLTKLLPHADGPSAVLTVNTHVRFGILPYIVECQNTEKSGVCQFSQIRTQNRLPWQHPLSNC